MINLSSRRMNTPKMPPMTPPKSLNASSGWSARFNAK